jgi:SOS-response transcriptional repressor LexA
MSYGSILARLRNEKGYTQHEVAEYISCLCNKSCTFRIVSNWETGISTPPAEQFLLMCEFYGVVDIQGTFRGADTDYLGLSRLSALGKSRVEEYISLLSDNPQFVKSEYLVSEMPRRYIRLYHQPVAAGWGYYLDSDAFDDFELDDTMPEDTDFAVKIGGDSMEPRFIDGQIIFIKAQQTLEVGEIGIFELNGDAYIKKFGNGEFISINPSYAPIPINEFDSIRVFGKVLG